MSTFLRSLRRWHWTTWAGLVLFGSYFVWLVRAWSACNGAGGTFVRTAFWFKCLP